jgi:hypothetical protein
MRSLVELIEHYFEDTLSGELVTKLGEDVTFDSD